LINSLRDMEFLLIKFESCPWRGVLDTIWCDKVCQWLWAGQWFSQGTPVSSTIKTYLLIITEILLKVALNPNPTISSFNKLVFFLYINIKKRRLLWSQVVWHVTALSHIHYHEFWHGEYCLALCVFPLPECIKFIFSLAATESS